MSKTSSRESDSEAPSGAERRQRAGEVDEDLAFLARARFQIEVDVERQPSESSLGPRNARSAHLPFGARQVNPRHSTRERGLRRLSPDRVRAENDDDGNGYYSRGRRPTQRTKAHRSADCYATSRLNESRTTDPEETGSKQ